MVSHISDCISIQSNVKSNALNIFILLSNVEIIIKQCGKMKFRKAGTDYEYD